MMSYHEIAKRLGISHGGVQFIEKRALAKIALAMGLRPEHVAEHLREAMRHELRRGVGKGRLAR